MYCAPDLMPAKNLSLPPAPCSGCRKMYLEKQHPDTFSSKPLHAQFRGSNNCYYLVKQGLQKLSSVDLQSSTSHATLAYDITRGEGFQLYVRMLQSSSIPKQMCKVYWQTPLQLLLIRWLHCLRFARVAKSQSLPGIRIAATVLRKG